MSKIEDSIINNLKILALDMISSSGSGDAGIIFSGANIFYDLFMNHLIYDPNDINFINKDRILVSNRLLPLLYSCNYLFYKDMSLDDLKDYKSFKSDLSGNAKKNSIINYSSLYSGDVISSSVGIALGERYLKSLVNFENNKSKLVDFKTYCVVTLEDLMSGIAYEAMSFASAHELNNLIFIVIKDEVSKDSSNKETFKEDLKDRFMSLKFNVEEINDNLGTIDGAIADAKESKKPSVIIVKSLYGKSSSIENSNKLYNKPLNKEEMDNLRNKYQINAPFEVNSNIINEIRKTTSKRLSKYLMNYQSLKQNSMGDLKIREIIDFLTKGHVDIELNPDNIKINDEYEEELLKSNNRILNLVASKSPFVLSASDDNFIYTLSEINKAQIMTKECPIGRNILIGNRPLALGGITCGLAFLGFKVFVSTPLVNESLLKSFIKISALNNLDITYIFTDDTFTNAYLDNEYHADNELNDLRSISNLVVYRPGDVNEVIGSYYTIGKLNKTSAIIVGSSRVPKLKGTNEKYVLAGAYRIKKESDKLDAIIITSGSEIILALRIVDELKDFNLSFRVVSMPSANLFAMQSEKYQKMLLPNDVKTFILEFSNSKSLEKYATNKDYIFGVDDFFVGGTKEEKLNYYHLNIDAIKTKMIELLKK